MRVAVGVQDLAPDLVVALRLDPARDERVEAQQSEDRPQGRLLVDQVEDRRLLDRQVDARDQIFSRRLMSSPSSCPGDRNALCWTSSAALNSSELVVARTCSLKPVSALVISTQSCPNSQTGTDAIAGLGAPTAGCPACPQTRGSAPASWPRSSSHSRR